jgi:hypothetical protein
MPRYRCCLLDENGEVLRTEVLMSSDERDARRDLMRLMVKIGRFASYELWEGSRRLAEFKPAAAHSGKT